MNARLLVSIAGMGLCALAGPGTAWADAAVADAKTAPAIAEAIWTPSFNFDLSRDCPQHTSNPDLLAVPEAAASLDDTGSGLEFRPFRLRDAFDPHWSYRPLDAGPMLEFAALGAGEKGRPKLVHLALDWDF